MSEIASLVGRLEKLTGPDRELDLAIDIVVRPTEYSQEVRDGKPIGAAASWYTDEEVPPYSRSIDAAMTLVPEGFAVDVCKFSSGKSNARLWTGEFLKPDQKFSTLDLPNLPATPAIALCIAALRARASLGSHDHE